MRISRDKFNLEAGVHQGAILCPNLFPIYPSSAGHNGRVKTRFLPEPVYADGLIFIVESVVELEKKFPVCKQNLESNGLKVKLEKKNPHPFRKMALFNLWTRVVTPYSTNRAKTRNK